MFIIFVLMFIAFRFIVTLRCLVVSNLMLRLKITFLSYMTRLDDTNKSVYFLIYGIQAWLNSIMN